MRARGFTLIEVMVALAIVTVGMAALLSAMSSSADNVMWLRDKTFAEWIALNRIEQTRLQFRKPSKGKTEGDVEYAGRRWRWEQEVLEVEIPGVLRVDVRVRPADAAAGGEGQWYTTVSGIIGDAIAPPRGDLPEYRSPGGGRSSGGSDSDDDEESGRSDDDGGEEAPQPVTPVDPGESQGDE